jgi:hypothetical protein
MTRWNRLRSWLRAMLRRSDMEREMDAELQFHLQERAEDLRRSGIPPEEAVRRAQMEFGGVERTKEECRDARGVNFVENLLQDLRHGLRMLRKSPGFTVVAILTLALGIGANTAIFSLMNALMFHSVPARDPATLVELLHRYPDEPAYNGFSWDAYQILRQNHTLSDLVVASPDTFVVRSRALEPHTVFGGFLSGPSLKRSDCNPPPAA